MGIVERFGGGSRPVQVGGQRIRGSAHGPLTDPALAVSDSLPPRHRRMTPRSNPDEGLPL